MVRRSMNRLVFAISISLCVLLQPRLAQSKGRSITLIGSVTCEEWVRGRAEERSMEPGKPMFLSIRSKAWLVGLLTGLNSGLSGPDLLAAANANLAFDWMDRFCLQNPQLDLYDGSNELLRELSAKTRK